MLRLLVPLALAAWFVYQLAEAREVEPKPQPRERAERSELHRDIERISRDIYRQRQPERRHPRI